MTRSVRPLADRSGIIIIQDGAVLLMHRIKQDQEFYCIPGGHLEAGETPEEAALRELEEETTLQVHGTLELFMELENAGRKEYYFLSPAGFYGTPQLSGEELGFMSATNNYTLVWVPFNKLSELVMHPKELHTKLCTFLKA